MYSWPIKDLIQGFYTCHCYAVLHATWSQNASRPVLTLWVHRVQLLLFLSGSTRLTYLYWSSWTDLFFCEVNVMLHCTCHHLGSAMELVYGSWRSYDWLLEEVWASWRVWGGGSVCDVCVVMDSGVCRCIYMQVVRLLQASKKLTQVLCLS